MAKRKARSFSWDFDPDRLQKAADDLEKRKAELAARQAQGDLNWIGLKPGTNIVRLLPGWRDEDHPEARDLPFLKIIHHKMIPPDKESHICYEQSYPERAKEEGYTCPVCAVIRKLFEEKVVTAMKDFGGNPYRKTTVFTNAVDRRKDGEVGIFGMPWGVYQDILPTITRWFMQEDPINVFDPWHGRDLEVEKAGQKLETTYKPQFAGRDSKIARADKQIDELLDGLYDLDKIFGWPSDKKMAAVEAAAEAMYQYWTSRASHSRSSDDDDSPVGKKKARQLVG